MTSMLWVYLILAALLCFSRPGTSNPTLIGFQYNAGYGYLQFTFDEEVLASTLNVSKLLFSGFTSALQGNLDFTSAYNDANVDVDDVYRSADVFQLKDNSFNDLSLQGNTTTPFVYTTTDDYARLIFYNYSFGMSASHAFMEMQEGAFTTYNGVACENVTTTPFLATTYYGDTLPPFVETFSFDANQGIMTLLFSEPIHRYGDGNETTDVIRMDGIAIQAETNIQSNLLSSTNYVQLVDYSDEDEIEILYTAKFGREVAVYIGYNNMNLIKVGSYVGKAAETTFFSLYSTNVANDTSGNALALANMDQFNALAVTTFVPDTSAPTLLWWSYDVFNGRATLRFSEVVDAMTFNYSAIYFSSNSSVDSSTTKLHVDAAGALETTQTADSNDIVMTLTESKLGELLDEPALLTNESNSYLVLYHGAPWDTSAAQNQYFDNSTQSYNARRIGYYLPDFVSPTITSAALDMTAKTLLLGFDKFISGASVNVSQLFLQSEASSGSGTDVFSFTATYASRVDPSAVDNKFVNLAISDTAFNYLKLFTDLSLRMDSTFVGLSADFVHDKAVNKNPVNAQPSSNAFALTGYTVDATAPTLTSWYADMNTGQLVMTFSEPLNHTSLDLSVITLYSDSDATAATTVSYQIANASLAGTAPTTSSDAADLCKITVQLNYEELNNIKDSVPVCQSYATCYLSTTSGFGSDIASYDHSSGAYVNNAVTAASVVQSSTDHVVDSIGPKIEYFTLDMNTGQLRLFLDEPVYSGYFDASGITFYNGTGVDSPVLSYALTTSSFVEEYISSQGLLVTFSRVDYLALKSIGVGVNGTSTAFITVSSTVLEDLAGNPLNGTRTNPDGSPTSAAAVTSDTTVPSLVAVYLDSTRYLNLYFSDIIDMSTFDLTYMYLYSPTENEAQTLMNAVLNSSEPTSDVMIYIPDALQAELLSDNIAQSQAQTQFYTTSNSVFFDVPNNNAGAVISVSNAITEGLQLLYWRLDLSNRIVRVAMSHVVSIASVDLTKFSIYSSNTLTEVSFTANDVYTIENHDTIVITLDVTTFGTITESMQVADKNFIYLNVLSSGVTDSNGLILGETTYSLTCRQVVIDTNPPSIAQYDLDLDEGTLNIYFDKPIKISTVQLSTLYLYAAQDTSANYVSLASGILTTTSDGVTTIAVDLNGGDFPTLRDQIHLTGDIGAAISSTYLQISKGFVTDTNDPANYLEVVALVNATQPSAIVQDETLPVLESWLIDIDKMVMNVTYDEAVEVSANLASYYLLLQDTGDVTSAQRYLLTSTTRSGSGRTITMDINNIDMNAIKLQPGLCTSTTDCLLSIRSSAITDIAHAANNYGGQLFAYATQPTSYQADITPPLIQHFNFSAQTGELWIEMTEIVDCSSVDLGQLRFQYASFLGTSGEYVNPIYSSPDCTYATGTRSKSLYVSLDVDDVTSIKAKSDLFKAIDSSFIGSGTAAFTDVFGNEFALITPGAAVQAIAYTPDITRPNMISYTVSSAKILFMYFDEPVDTSDFDVTKIQVSNAPYPNYDNAYNLSATSGFSSLYAADTYKKIIQISLEGDYTYISAESAIFEVQESTYLNIYPGLVTDTGGNDVAGISPENAVGLGPNIYSWTLSMNTGVLTVEFSEAVFENFSVAGLKFQRTFDIADGNGVSVTLTSHQNMTKIDETNFEITLIRDDLNSLKYNDIGFNKLYSYLVAFFGVSYSIVESTLVPNLRTSSIFDYRALQASAVTLDTTVPVIESFGLDLNVGSIIVRFDEPVDTSTLDFTGFSLLSSTEGSTVALTTAINVTVVNMTNLVVFFAGTEFNNVKIAEAAGALDGLVVAQGSIHDVSGNIYPGNNEQNFIPIKNSTEDNTAPVLLQADLNLLTGELDLTFDEVVDLDVFLPEYVTLLSTADPTDPNTVSVQLTNMSLVSMDDAGKVTIDFQTYQTDQKSIALAQATGLATGTSNTFVQYQHISDVFGNKGLSATVRQADSFTPDTSTIDVVAFDFIDDYAANSMYIMSIFYNKVVEVSTFKCSEYSVLLTAAGSPQALSDGDCAVTTAEAFTNAISFQITETTATAINTLLSGGGDVTFMNITGSVDSEGTGTGIKDTHGNFLSPSTQQLEIGPHVRRWFLDLNSGRFTFVFSSPVNASSPFNSSALGLYSPTTSQEYWLTTASQAVYQSVDNGLPENTTSVYYTVDSADLDNIKALDVETSVYLQVRHGLLFNTRGTLDVVTIPATALLEPYILTEDSARPVLLNSSMDIGNSRLTLTFNEPIRTSEISQSNIKLVAAQSSYEALSNRDDDASASSTEPPGLFLGNAGASPSRNGNSITLTMSAADQAGVMLMGGLAKNRSTTYFWYYSNTFYDYAGNAANSITSEYAVLVGEYVPDTVSPILYTFDANMDTGKLTLTFTEPVAVSTINTTAITVSERNSQQAGNQFRLTGGTILTSDASVIDLQLSDEDIASIKGTQGLARDDSSLYLIIDATFCQDTSGNAIKPIIEGGGLVVTTFIADSTSPYVVAVDMDVESERLTLNMSEKVILSSVSLSDLTVQDDTTSSSNSHALSTSSSVYNPASLLYDEQIVIDFSAADINQMKDLYPLVSRQNASCISVTSSFVTDVYSNSVTQITTTNAHAADSFSPDISPPAVADYALDMATLQITMTWDEAIKFASVDISQANLQQHIRTSYGPGKSLSATTASSSSGSNSIYLYVIIDTETAAYVKYNRIADQLSTSYFAFSATFLSDNMDIFALPKWDGSIYLFEPFLPNTYIADSVAPKLSRWQIDRTNHIVILHFDEPVTLTNATSIIISSAASTSVTSAITARLGDITNHTTTANYARKHSFYIHEESCSYTNTTAGECMPSALHEIFQTTAFYLLMDSASFSDYAYVPNSNAAMLSSDDAVVESSPECSTCSSGFYASAVCTEVEDRVCSTCSTCADGYYQAEACSSYADTNCKECKSCAYGKYISTACGATNDNVCTDCTSCGLLEFESVKCQLGLNTQCTTCENCALSSADEAICRSKGKYQSWYDANCCLDADGTQVACGELDRANMEISKRNGRHHWVFEDDSVDMSIYGLGSDF